MDMVSSLRLTLLCQFSAVVGFIPFFPDGPFGPLPPFDPGPGPLGGGRGAVAVVQTGPEQVVGGGPLISANNAFYDNIGIFPVVNVPTGVGTPAGPLTPCFALNMAGQNLQGCPFMNVASFEVCQQNCLALGPAVCAGVSFTVGANICGLCAPNTIANAGFIPETDTSLFLRNTACGEGFNALAFSNIRSPPGGAQAVINQVAAVRSAAVQAVRAQGPRAQFAAVRAAGGSPETATNPPPATTRNTKTTTTTPVPETTTHAPTTTSPATTTQTTSPATTTTSGMRNALNRIEYSGDRTVSNHRTKERVITVPADYPNGELQLFVSGLMKLGYKSITMNSKIRGGVPLCSPCDQYTCISACIIISGMECEGVVYNLETQTCYGHKKGTDCHFMIYEQTSFYASKTTCDSSDTSSSTILKYGKRKLYVHKNPDHSLSSTLRLMSPRSLDDISLQNSILLTMVKRVANNFGYFVVPSDNVASNLKFLTDVDSRIDNFKHQRIKTQRKWFDYSGEDVYEKTKPTVTIDKVEYLWRMPSIKGLGSSKRWIEIEHYHGLGGSLLAQQVTKSTCVFMCKTKEDCFSLDYDVRTKSCWYHTKAPKCSALRSRQNITHIRNAPCKKRTSDFI